MSELPAVACILMTKDRPEYARQAVEAFRAQTYPADKRTLLILDGGDVHWYTAGPGAQLQPFGAAHADRLNEFHVLTNRGSMIGELRNDANGCGFVRRAEFIMHLDSDDYSAATRIEDQVNRLLVTGKSVTGYRQIPFLNVETGEWWMYNGTPQYASGTTLCYRKSFWEKHKFRAVEHTEDRYFVDDAVVAREFINSEMPNPPLMFARIHKGNTVAKQTTNKTNWEKLPASYGTHFPMLDMAVAAR